MPGLAFRWIALALVAVAVAAGLVVVNPLGLLDADESAEADPVRERAAIVVDDLTATIESDGELRPGQQRQAATPGPGTVTALAPVGTEVEASTVLFAIDHRPAVALVGQTPAWRTMTVDDVGRDVEQLETNLVALGYDPDGLLSVDDTFTDDTAVVVERWQSDLGLEPTGSVALGSVVFVPDGARVTSLAASTGDVLAAGATVTLATVSTGQRQLVFPVAAQDLATIAAGTTASARLPDRSTLTAEVDEIGPSGDGGWLATATVSGGIGEPTLDGEAVPVTVSWTSEVATATTTVPANALTRLDSGAYVLEVVDGEDTGFVEVEVGVQVGSTVEIFTNLEPGTVVIAP